MNTITCPDCGTNYQNTLEIQHMGGRVYHIGLAIKGRCFCGADLGNVSKIWKRRKVRNDKR